MPYYVLGEILAPIFQALSVLVIVLGFVLGLLGWRELIQSMLVLSFGNAMLTNAALLLLERHTGTFRGRDLRFLVLLAPFDLFLYRPILFWAQFKGMIDFLRGDRGWDKFVRNERSAPVA
jgi:hypothetical protein